MALLKCEDCGREVSSKASACPHCGCPVPSEQPTLVAPERSHSGVALPTAWTQSEPPPIPSEPAGTFPPDVLRALKWVAALLVLAVLIRACGSGDGAEGTQESTSTDATTVPPVVKTELPSGPSEADKIRWTQNLTDKDAGPGAKQTAARELLKNFPQSPEAQQAAALLPEIDKAVAYEAMGRQWAYEAAEEGMSGKKVRTAQVQSTNTISLDFPYTGAQHGTLMLRRHPRWGNDVIFSLEKGQILCHSYGDCDVRVRFDDGSVSRYEGNPPSDNSSEYVFIPAFGTFMKRLQGAKTVKVEVQIYQSGNQVFEFDVSGFKPENFK